MSATLRQVREQLEARLKTLTGAAINLTVADAVRVGRYPARWRLPCAELFLVSDRAAVGPVLVGRERTAVFGVQIWIGSSDTKPQTRQGVIEDVLEAVMALFRSAEARTLGRLVIDVLPSFEEAFGAEAEPADCVQVVISLTVRYREAS